MTILDYVKTLSGRVVAAAFAVTLLAAPGQRVAAQNFVDNELEQSFDVRSGGELYVDTDRGSINVETGSSDRVRILIERRSRGASDREMDRLKFRFDKSGDRVSVRGEYEGDRPRGSANRFDVRIRIQVPEKFDVDLNTSGGSIEVADLIGSVTAETSGGSLTFGRISGPVDGHTSGGSIQLTHSVGDAQLRTSGGSIKIGEVGGTVMAQTSGGSISIDEAAGSVVAKTSGGQIKVREVRGAIDASTSGGGIDVYISRQPEADCRLSTGGGHVTVRLDPKLRLNIQARASGGGIRTDLPISVQGKVTRGRLYGTMNGGGPVLDLHTSGGGITVESTR